MSFCWHSEFLLRFSNKASNVCHYILWHQPYEWWQGCGVSVGRLVHHFGQILKYLNNNNRLKWFCFVQYIHVHVFEQNFLIPDDHWMDFPENLNSQSSLVNLRVKFWYASPWLMFKYLQNWHHRQPELHFMFKGHLQMLAWRPAKLRLWTR